jgi:predicted transcriptional regulator
MVMNEKIRLDERRVRVILRISQSSDSSIPELMFHTFLCYETLKKYLAILMEKGLLSSCKDNRRRFFTTQEGEKFLRDAGSSFHLDYLETQQEKQGIELVTPKNVKYH